jgi:glycosyltransferase involved in cell wall biosynthesis
MSARVKGQVSVIVPTFNREKLVVETVDSILAQTYDNLQVVVVDDGSQDGTQAVLEGLRTKDARVTIVSQANAGQVRARNNGLQHATGEFVAFLDSDDTWHTTKLEKQIPLFVDQVGMVYSGINEIDDCGEQIRVVNCEPGMRGDIYDRLLVKNRMTGGTVLVSHAVLDDVGHFDESLDAAENWDLWIRIARSYKIEFVDEPLVNYRVHQGNMSKGSQLMLDARLRILQKHFAGKPSDPQRLATYREANAEYWYRAGVMHFGVGAYSAARPCFAKAMAFRSLYRDCLVRWLRCWLGKHGNLMISQIKGLLPR